MEPENETVTEGTRADEVRQDRLWFLESMDRINRTIQGADDFEQMSHVLDAVLSIFGCDRAWIVYPCDAESRTWRTVAERARPEFAHSVFLGLDLPMDAEVAHVHRVVGASEAAVRFAPGAINPIPSGIAERFGVQSQICLAVCPKTDKPYMFGLDQCASARNWTQAEQSLFEATGQRLSILLTSLSMSRDLQESKARLEEAQRVAHVGHWEWDLETDVVVWSDETYRIFGLRPQERPMDLATVRGMVHPEDRESLYSGVDEDLVAGVRPDAEFRIVLPSKEVRTVHALTSKRWSSMPGDSKKDASGRPYELFGTVQDITERRCAEEALQRTQVDLSEVMRELRRQQEYLTEAQSLTHTGSWACNLVTRQIFHSSDENARLYGFDPSQGPIPFDRYYSTILPEDERAIRATLENAISAGADYDVEFRIRRTDGAIRFMRGIGHHNPSQETGEYVGITMDITERKHAEEERERLRQLETDLAHINRINMMGELAAALAHEIKQPIAASITSANACLRWLAHNPPDLERARAATARIEREGNRAADIINSLRSFYKTGTPAERRMVDVKDTIGEMTVLLRMEAVRHSITIHAEFEPEMPYILADRVQLQQVLMNLMLNAIEAMKDTGGELTIRSRVNPEGHLTVSISDTGVGLPAESADRIFDPFHTTKSQGTGMGLTITRSIVESYGGRVWATANQGAGTTFHFTLPRAEAYA
jgi:signal transduction histidine kinase